MVTVSQFIQAQIQFQSKINNSTARFEIGSPNNFMMYVPGQGIPLNDPLIYSLIWNIQNNAAY